MCQFSFAFIVGIQWWWWMEEAKSCQSQLCSVSCESNQVIRARSLIVESITPTQKCQKHYDKCAARQWFTRQSQHPRIKLYIRLTGAYQVAVKKGLQEDVRILETFFHIPLKVKDARGKRETWKRCKCLIQVASLIQLPRNCAIHLMLPPSTLSSQLPTRSSKSSSLRTVSGARIVDLI